MLTAANTQYDFSGQSRKPWHLKGSYQLYDEFGNPAQKGTYEYWWQSATVHRSSWTRTDASRTEWHTVDGKTLYKATGDRLLFLEHALERFLFSPIPDPGKLDSTRVEFKKNQLEVGKIKLPCAEISARAQSNGTKPLLPDLPLGNYCFDPSLPVLRVERLFNSIFVEFDNLTKTQNRVLAHKITITASGQKLLVFDIDMMDELPIENGVLTPPADAAPASPESLRSSASAATLIKKTVPFYPLAAKSSHVSGLVILDAIIGKDGGVQDVRVLETPSPLLVSASKYAIAQWQYKPSIVDGEPQESTTIINVIFSLGK